MNCIFNVYQQSSSKMIEEEDIQMNSKLLKI